MCVGQHTPGILQSRQQTGTEPGPAVGVDDLPARQRSGALGQMLLAKQIAANGPGGEIFGFDVATKETGNSGRRRERMQEACPMKSEEGSGLPRYNSRKVVVPPDVAAEGTPLTVRQPLSSMS